MVLVDRIPQEQWLVSWSSAKAAAPTWEPAAIMRAQFPHLHLEDKALPMGRGIDTDPAQQDESAVVQAQNRQNSGPDREETEPSIKKAQNQKKKTQPTRKKSRPSKFKDYILH